MRAWVVLLLATTALAGCSDAPERSVDGGHDHGAFHTCPDGTVIDPGAYADHHEPDFDPASKCPAPDASARVTLRVDAADAASATAYQPVTLRWDVTPAGDATGVSESQVRSSREDAAAPEAPEAYGELVAEATDREAPFEAVAEWTPVEDGVYFLRAHARVGDDVVWSDAVRVEVAPVAPTDVVHTITINTGTTEPELDPADLEVVVGDAVQWQNTDPALTYAIASSDGPSSFDGTADPNAPSDDVVFLRAGTWTYTVTDALLGRSASGTITVTPP